MLQQCRSLLGVDMAGFEFPSAEFYKELAPRPNWSIEYGSMARGFQKGIVPAISDNV